MHGQQLSKRVVKKQPKTQQNSNIFLRLKAETIQLFNQIDLYHNHNKSNYISIVKRISAELCSCTQQQQGELCLILCQTTFSMGLPLLQVPLPQKFAQLVIIYINSLFQKEDTHLGQNLSFRQVYEGKFKAFKQRKQRFDNQQKLRDLLLIQRIDKVLALIVDHLRQKKSQIKISKKAIDCMSRTINLASRYLATEEFQKFQKHIQIITCNGSKSNVTKQSKSTPIYRNFVIIDQQEKKQDDTDQVDQKVNNTQSFPKKQPIHRTSSRIHVLKTSSFYDSIDSSNITEIQEQKKTFKGSQRLKISLKRGSGSSFTKRGSIQTKKSVQHIIRKSIHLNSKQMLQIKTGIAKIQRKSRFQPSSKNDMDILREQALTQRPQGQVNQSEAVNGSKRESYHFPSSDEQNNFCKTSKEFYVFLLEKNRLSTLILKPNIEISLINEIDTFGKQKQLQLLFEDYSIFYISNVFEQGKKANDLEEQYLQRLSSQFLPYRNNRNQLVFINKKVQKQNKSKKKNVFRVFDSRQVLLMGFIRKGSTHFIVQCLFDRLQLYNCYEAGLKRRLVSQYATIPFRVVYSYRLMNQDLYMTYEQKKSVSVKQGSVICTTQKKDYNEAIKQTDEKKYKIALTQFSFKESEQIVRFITFWEKQSEVVLYGMPKFKKKQTTSGPQIIMKQKINTFSYDQKRIKRVPLNKSSIKLHQNELQKLLQNNQSLRINSIHKTSSKKQVPSSEKLVTDQRMLKKVKKRKKRINSGKQMIETIRTEKGYKLVRKCIIQNPDGIIYTQYYGYLQRRANLIEYHRSESNSFSKLNHNNYLKSRLTIHGKKSNIQANNTKLLTFMKRLKNESSLLGYLVGSIKLMSGRNRYVFLEVYWQSMQKYFIFVFSQDVFQKMTHIQLDHFEKHQFSSTTQKQQQKKRDKRTSVVSSLMRNREKQGYSLKKSNQSYINTLRVPKMMSFQRENQNYSKSQTSNKFKDMNKNTGSNLRTNNFFKAEKTNESFSFSSLSNMKWTERLHFKREVAAYIKNKLIRYMQFSQKNNNLVLELRHPNLEQNLLQLNGKELAVKNIHFSKKKHQAKKQSQYQQFEVAATELLVIKYKESNLANLKFYTCQGLNKIYFEHIFIKNSDDLFGCYKNTIPLRQIEENKYRIQDFYSKSTCFFQNSSKQQIFLPVIQPIFRHVLSKYSNKEEQKRYKYVQIINFAKNCSLSFDFVENKRKKKIKDLFMIPNRYPHLGLKHFMFVVQITFDQILIKDLNGNKLLVFQRQKLLIYFPYAFQSTKSQLKKLLMNRLLKDPDLIRLCQQKISRPQ